jgi:hypothetical protein
VFVLYFVLLPLQMRRYSLYPDRRHSYFEKEGWMVPMNRVTAVMDFRCYFLVKRVLSVQESVRDWWALRQIKKRQRRRRETRVEKWEPERARWRERGVHVMGRWCVELTRPGVRVVRRDRVWRGGIDRCVV